jgi:hypothetical protein
MADVLGQVKTDALTVIGPASQDFCGYCGAHLVCVFCATGDLLASARLALAEAVRGNGGKGVMAKVVAAKIILAKDFLTHLSDEDLLAEVNRRRLSHKEKKNG